MRDHGQPQAPTRSAPQRAGERHRPARAAGAAARGDLGGASARDLLALQRTAGNAAVAEAAGRHVHDSSCGHQVQRAAVQEVLGRSGKPLEPGVREEMESRLGADFSGVRVHTDNAAHTAAESVQAHAFTSGDDIVFQRGRYDTGSTAGKTMLAHELVHVVQQRSGPVAGTDTGSGLKVSDPADRFEREAEATARRAMSGAPAAPASAKAPAGPAGAGTVQRARAGAAAQEALESTSAVGGAGASFTVGQDFANPDATTTHSLNTGMVAPGMAAMGAGFGLYESIRAFFGARRGMEGTEEGTAAHREHRRARNGAVGDGSQSGFNFVGNTTGFGGGAAKIAESGAADLVAGTGLGITLPAALIQGGRYIRKAEKANERVKALATLLHGKTDDSDLRTLIAYRDLTVALLEFLEGQKEWQGKLQDDIRQLENRPESPGAAVPDSMTGFAAEIDTAFAPKTDPAAELMRAELERMLEGTKDIDARIAEATEAKRRCDEQLHDSIGAYALKKNNRGWYKKTTIATGSLATFLGGVATLVATFAAGAAVGATPLGWALAGLGATIGIAIAAYKTSKYFDKRWDRARLDENGNERTWGARIRATLNVAKSLGPGKRELVARTLWEMADEEHRGSVAEGHETSFAGVEIPEGAALSIIAALGLNWKAQKMSEDRESAISLIAAKMAS